MQFAKSKLLLSLTLFSVSLALYSQPLLAASAESKELEGQDRRAVQPSTPVVTPAGLPFTLCLGVSRDLVLPFVADKVTITSPSLLSFKLRREGKQTTIRVIPQAEGVTNFQVEDGLGNESYTALVRILGGPLAEEYLELEALTQRYPRVRVEVFGNGLLLAGEVDSLEGLRVARGVAKVGTGVPLGVQSLVRLSQEGKEALAGRIERAIGSPDIVAYFTGDTLFLEGITSTEFEADRSVALATAHLQNLREGRLPASKQLGPPSSESSVSKAEEAQEFPLVDLLRVRPAEKKGTRTKRGH
jgi:hypothetical protein